MSSSLDSDSSDEEEMQKFRDAADPQLLNDNMFKDISARGIISFWLCL